MPRPATLAGAILLHMADRVPLAASLKERRLRLRPRRMRLAMKRDSPKAKLKALRLAGADAWGREVESRAAGHPMASGTLASLAAAPLLAIASTDSDRPAPDEVVVCWVDRSVHCR